MRSRPAAVSLAVILLALLAGTTRAYFTDTGEAVNVITSGKIDIVLHETRIQDGEEKPYEGAVEVVPGKSVSKIVRVQNTGNSPAYVRVSVDRELRLAEGVEGTADDSLISIDFDTVNWIYSDGYYYYKAPLEPGKYTEALFESVDFAAEMPNLYKRGTASVTVRAFATQVRNNDTGGPLGAEGWPEA